MSTGLVLPASVVAKIAKGTERTETCASCKYRFLPEAPAGKKADVECRRRAPSTSVLLVPMQTPAITRGGPATQLMPQNFSTFPLIRDEFWCGEWEANPGLVS